jgi:broad specificity phosphatase PhoE
MLRVILARHGQTTWNHEARCQGGQDVPLTEAGQQQADLLAERLAAQTLDAIYASDLSRAWDTAQAIAIYHTCPPRPEPRLREFGKGVWEGLTWDAIRLKHAAQFAAWQDHRIPPPGGETLDAAAARLDALLADLRRDHAGHTVLLVGHGAMLRMLICGALGLGPDRTWDFDMGNAALSELHLHPTGAVLHRLNDTAHLGRVF